MWGDIGYSILMFVLLIVEFPLALIVYLVLSIMYCLYVILEFILRPFKILFEKLIQ